MSEPHHDEHLAHHFDTIEQQSESTKLGMWLFLVTEILLFGGLFCWYAVYRANHPEIFIYAHQFLNKVLGGVNTIVLICSSLTMAWAVRCAQLGDTKKLIRLLAITLAFACCFLGIKYVEYSHKWHEGLLWASRYAPAHATKSGVENAGENGGEHSEEEPGDAPVKPAVDAPVETGEEKSLIAPAAEGPEGLAPDAAESEGAGHGKSEPENVGLFFSIYFVMTGLHMVHVLAGMGVIFWLLLRARKNHFGPKNFTAVDLGGLYWHIVDVVWIFLFPLLYLIH